MVRCYAGLYIDARVISCPMAVSTSDGRSVNFLLSVVRHAVPGDVVVSVD